MRFRRLRVPGLRFLRGFRLFSSITHRILAVNMLALGILVAGVLFQEEYQAGLLSSELAGLETQAEMFAAALGEGAVAAATGQDQNLMMETARQMVRRLVRKGTRARLFATDGRLVADSRYLSGFAGRTGIEVQELSPPPDLGLFERLVRTSFEWITDLMAGHHNFPVYEEAATQIAPDYTEVVMALNGEHAGMVRHMADGRMMVSVSVPVQRYKQVLGGLMLSTSSDGIDQALLDVRVRILQIFFLVLGVTTLLSLYLAGTIARPLKLLAVAAERVRHGANRQRGNIPDLTNRRDEIGELSGALREMTGALWARMDAIERFAADVSHEIKNPLTSLRSAVETVRRIKDPDQQRRLMDIILEDVQRLDRLISDISDASRLDSELSRSEMAEVDLKIMMGALVDIHQLLDDAGNPAPGPRLELTLATDNLWVNAMEGRLVQVFRNLITNAMSFSPPDGVVKIIATAERGKVVVAVEDQGPGIPPGKEDKIFERFYSERPSGEDFGKHSGLGLSISRQIAEAHGGSLTAQNRLDEKGNILGARFVVTLDQSPK